MSASKDRSKNDVFLTKAEAMGICNVCEATFNEEMMPYLHIYSFGGKTQYLKEEVVKAYMTLAVVKAPEKKLPQRPNRAR